MQSLYFLLMKFVSSYLMSLRHLMKFDRWDSTKNIWLLKIFSFSTKYVNLLEISASRLKILAKFIPFIYFDLSKYF